MKKMMQGSLEGVKSLYGAPTKEMLNVAAAEEYFKTVEMHLQMPRIIQENIEAQLTEEQLNILQWAKEFMERYER